MRQTQTCRRRCTPGSLSRLSLLSPPTPPSISLLPSQTSLLLPSVRQALAADAVMSLAPWALYGADQAPTPVAVRAKAPLERGLAADPAHPYLCHLRVHLDEMGPRHSSAASPQEQAGGRPLTRRPRVPRRARYHWPSAEARRSRDMSATCPRTVHDMSCTSAEALRRTDATDAGPSLHMPSQLFIITEWFKNCIGGPPAAHALAPRHPGDALARQQPVVSGSSS